MGEVANRLREMNIVLPNPAAPVANYVAWTRAGSLLFISGQLPLGPDGKLAAHLTGKLAHRLSGFSDDTINRMFTSAGVEWRDPVAIPGTLPIRIWPAVRVAAAAIPELAV